MVQSVVKLHIWIINGKTGFRDTIIRGGCNCEMINLTAIPDWLMETKNEGFRKAIESQWQTENTNPDYSLQGLLDAHLIQRQNPNNSPFKRIINARQAGTKGKKVFLILDLALFRAIH